MGEFDYRVAVEEDVRRLAGALTGMTLGEIPGARFGASSAVRGKGEVGLAVERFFGIPPNTRSEADFPGAGIELKIVPLIRRGRGFRVKERTVIGMIDYERLVEQTWATADIRKKLKILFVFFEHLPDESKAAFPVRKVVLWEPDEDQSAIIRADWERVRGKVAAGRAHELSESDGLLLGPCTKGAHSKVRVPQPNPLYANDAKPRAFALKPAFTYAIYRQATDREAQESILEGGAGDLVARITERFKPLVGKKVGEVAESLGIEQSESKSYAARVIRRALSAPSEATRIKELEEVGVSIRTTRIDPDGMPYEAMSFPHFRYMELIEETWEDSTLLSQLEALLIVPYRGRLRSTSAWDCILGRPFLWRPTRAELDVAAKEWKRFQRLIANGKALELPGEAETQMIHVRPHARDHTDTLLAPGVGPVVKKSFWLNRRFVAELVARHS